MFLENLCLSLQNNGGGSIINITATLHYNGCPYQVKIYRWPRFNFPGLVSNKSSSISWVSSAILEQMVQILHRLTLVMIIRCIKTFRIDTI